MYYEFEGRQNMKTLIFDEESLIVGDQSYPYSQIENLEVTSTPLFAAYGLMRAQVNGKEVVIPFPRSYASKLKRVIHEVVHELENRKAAADSLTAAGASIPDPYEEMKKLKELLDLNIITQEEFARKKKELLGL